MRRTITLVALAVTVMGCGMFRKAFGVTDESPAHTEPQTTSPFGEWVLATHPDSTAFAGATRVELQLNPRNFVITAMYPGRDPVVVTGEITYTDAGRLTFIPTRTTQGYGPRNGALAFAAGEPITLLASAAGGSLVFVPDAEAFVPSSVWHKKEQAKQAAPVRDST